MTQSEKNEFIPIGMPKGSSPEDSVDERLGLHLLETLEALASVYSSASFFAGMETDEVIVDYTLSRCLQCVEADHGVVFVVRDGRLEQRSSRGEIEEQLDVVALADVRHAQICTGAGATRFVSGEQERSVLLAPIATEEERLGLVVILNPRTKPFTTLDAKLASAVTSQAAIALRSAIYYRDVEIERQKLRSVIDQHSEGIVVLDGKGETLLCNPAARRVCGFGRDPAEAPDALTDCLVAAGIDRESLIAGDLRDEVTLGDVDSSRVVGLVANAIRNDDGSVVNVILGLRDLTEERREERLKCDFLSLLSHKFRTPITAILGALMLMEDDSLDPSGRDEFVHEVGQRTKELELLVNRLLFFSEVTEGTWSAGGDSALAELVPELVEEFSQRFGKRGLQLEWSLDGGDGRLAISPALLRIVLENLIENAVKFGPRENPWVRVVSRTVSGRRLRVEVEDVGPGISPMHRDKVFTSFYQQEESFTGNVPGVGLGLAMAASIVNRVGGTIDFRDREPRGTVFAFELPLLDPSTAP